MHKKTGNGCSRRLFLQYSATVGAMAALQWGCSYRSTGALAEGPYGVTSPRLRKYVDLMRGIGGIGIPVAQADSFAAPVTGVQHYTVNIGPYNDVLHSDFVTPGKPAFVSGFAGTKLFGYGQGTSFKHLGGLIIAQRNVPVQITFNNHLPAAQIMPNDATLPQPQAQRSDRTAIHLHGGHVPWISDGGPHDWWAPDGVMGTSFLNNTVLNPGGHAGAGRILLPQRPERPVHVVPRPRLGDHPDERLCRARHRPTCSSIPRPKPPSTPPIPGFRRPSTWAASTSITSISFSRTRSSSDPDGPPADYGANAGPGRSVLRLQVRSRPCSGRPEPRRSERTLLSPPPVPSCVPEFFGDTILVNGTAYPLLEVEARPIRVRMLNACSSRFLNPRLVATRGKRLSPTTTSPLVSALGPRFPPDRDRGRLSAPGGPVDRDGRITAAPGARREGRSSGRLLAASPPGTEFILYNDAPGPFPGGDGTFDFYSEQQPDPVDPGRLRARFQDLAQGPRQEPDDGRHAAAGDDQHRHRQPERPSPGRPDAGRADAHSGDRSPWAA